MLRIHFHRPTPSLEQFVRFYVQREVQIRGAAVVHPVPARAAPLIEVDFGDPIKVLDYKQLAQRKSPAVVIVGSADISQGRNAPARGSRVFRDHVPARWIAPAILHPHARTDRQRL
jgi:hypothetical protein